MPLVPNTLAAAEDLNATLNDIAQALTNSLATDGSNAFQGGLNMNNQNLTGIATLSANAISTNYLTSNGNINVAGSLTGNQVVMNGLIQTSGGRIISAGYANNPSVTCWDTQEGYAAGMLVSGGGSNSLLFANMDGNGNYASTLGIFNSNGDFTAIGSLNTYSGIVWSPTGWLNLEGNVHIFGGAWVDAVITANAGISITSGDLQMNGHWIFNLGQITPPAGTVVCDGTFHTNYNLDAAHDVVCGGWTYSTRIVTRDAGGYSWAFGINGPYGFAQADGGPVFLFGAASSRDLKDNIAPCTAPVLDLLHATPISQFDIEGRHYDAGFILEETPSPFVFDIDGNKAIDHQAILGALVAAVQTLDRRLAALELAQTTA